MPGVHAYAQRSVEAGEAVRFRVSSDTPYDLEVTRAGDSAPLARLSQRSPSVQPIHVGSYVHVEDGLPGEPLESLTIETWVRCWAVGQRQGIVTACDGDVGTGLFVSSGGWVEFLLGDWRVAHAELRERRWHHLALVWDGAAVSVFVDARFQGSWRQPGRLAAAGIPLRLGASGGDGRATEFLDGDIAMPAVYARPHSAAEVTRRYEARALDPPESPVLAWWPLDEERGTAVRDGTGGTRAGTIVNRATWMIGGPAFDASSPARHEEYDPSRDPGRGHGLRFASDDLYDCRWDPTHEIQVPPDAKPGVYTGRFALRGQREGLHYDVTFLVRGSPSQARAPILALCSTNTWQAYSATPFAVNSGERFWETTGHENAHPAAPAYCCYRGHAQGQPTYAVGMALPWPVAGPDVLFSRDGLDYSHLTRAELFAHRWLEESSYGYDVAADYDLHRDPSLLDGRKVILINGHSEYWSVEAYRAVDAFLSAGGAAIVMSGNTMFWRVSYDEDGAAMECRKYGVDIGGQIGADIGEIFHSHDGRRGSLMRFCGLPAWRVLGLECIGWWPVREAYFGAYETLAPDHFLFNEPEPTGLRLGEPFGQSPEGEPPRVGGHESDVRPSMIRAITRQGPPGAEVPDDPPGIVPLARIVDSSRRGIDYFGRWEPLDHGVYAEMVYWERPQGGRVLHAGCIAGGWALSVDPAMQALVRNALHHFGVRRA